MQQPAQADPSLKRYLVLFSKGPNWLEGRLFKDQPEAGQHAAYTERLSAEGTLIRGVALADASGSVALFLATDLETARRLIEADPMVRAGVMQGDVYEWRGSIPGEQVAKP